MSRLVWVAFFLFCLLSSAGWLIPADAADATPLLERQSILYGVVGLAGILFAARGMIARRNWRLWVWLGLGGIGFFGVPVVFFAWPGVGLSDIIRSVSFAVAPLVVMLVVAASGRDGAGARRLLAPALVGFAGVLFLLPFELSYAVRDLFVLGGLFVVVVLVGVLSVWMYGLLQESALEEAVAVVGLSNAAFLMVCGLVGGDFVWRWCALASVVSIASLVDVVEVVLILWLLREMVPVRFAARYLVIPLLTVLGGYVILRPELTVRMGFGVVLLSVGAGLVLFSRSSSDEAILSLR